ncbi:hypothetical protein BDZ94DRAFT_1258518 [Collybia nuda]|uniref:Uncharacterized protein n=1 Tax=Collybia nuda TaxID=64659 RepID=A0A9P5Y5A7_9AGAR|nr:hypothetical protein BDZ94DRAFT_1258518 [Collybia nuda]
MTLALLMNCSYLTQTSVLHPRSHTAYSLMPRQNGLSIFLQPGPSNPLNLVTLSNSPRTENRKALAQHCDIFPSPIKLHDFMSHIGGIAENSPEHPAEAQTSSPLLLLDSYAKQGGYRYLSQDDKKLKEIPP